jgi:hypothetical protein
MRPHGRPSRPPLPSIYVPAADAPAACPRPPLALALPALSLACLPPVTRCVRLTLPCPESAVLSPLPCSKPLPALLRPFIRRPIPVSPSPWSRISTYSLALLTVPRLPHARARPECAGRATPAQSQCAGASPGWPSPFQTLPMVAVLLIKPTCRFHLLSTRSTMPSAIAP